MYGDRKYSSNDPVKDTLAKVKTHPSNDGVSTPPSVYGYSTYPLNDPIKVSLANVKVTLEQRATWNDAKGVSCSGNELGFDLWSKPEMLNNQSISKDVPIILVPNASKTSINLYNVKEFLEDGVFTPSDVKANQLKGPKPDYITVQKKFSKERVLAAYEVRDKPSALNRGEWNRVVAGFVLGKEWQFKDLPFKDPAGIFQKIVGFYMQFDDESVDSAKMVKQWNVKIITISRNKRHQDRAAALEV